MLIEEEDQIIQDLKQAERRRKAFEHLVSQYSPQLYRQIRRMVYSHDDTNDILQNTFIKAWTNIESFRGDARLSTWLYKIALNETLNFIHREKEMNAIDTTDTSVTNRLMADEYFDGDETQKLFLKAIQTLPPKQRIIFNLRYFKEMKYEEISDIMGTSIGGLKSSYHHAVKKIEEFLAKHA